MKVKKTFDSSIVHVQ